MMASPLFKQLKFTPVYTTDVAPLRKTSDSNLGIVHQDEHRLACICNFKNYHFQFVIISLLWLVYVRACTYVRYGGVYTCSCIHVHVEAKRQHQVYSSIALHLIFWVSFSFWTWSSLTCLGWLAGWQQPMICLSLSPQFWNSRLMWQHPALEVGTVVLNSGPRFYMASTCTY